jgi:hypothetical protein
MALPGTTNTALPSIVGNLQNLALSVKSQAQNALISLQTGPVNSAFIFQFLDQMRGLIAQLNSWTSVAGLNAYATANMPGYAGTLTADIAAVVSAGQACIAWIVANFPVDSGGFLQAEKLNADGSRTSTSFTSAQTAGLQTALQAFIATIG